MTNLELTSNRTLKALVKSRYPQLVLLTITLVGYVFAIMAGLVGTPVGSRNFSIVFVWIAWWAILILIAVPFFGRGWCAICPIPLPGEWLQRGAILGPTGKAPRWLNLRWPKAFRNIWLQNASFLLLALFSSLLLTTPSTTAIVLATMLFAAIGLSMVFERRAFCRYLCPVGGFIGLYSQAAPVELRIKNKRVCTACDGTSVASLSVSRMKRTRTNSDGHSARSGFGVTPRAFTVPEPGCTAWSMKYKSPTRGVIDPSAR